MKFQDMVEAQDKKFEREPITDARILCFDPGHTTGWAFFKGTELTEAGQIKTDDMETAPHRVRELFQKFDPTVVICEDYRIYKWRMEEHVGSQVLTTRVIGSIETLCAFDFIPIIKNMAVTAKRFVTDAKLVEWEMYRKGERHARDAIRHGCYYIIFHHLHDKKPKNNPHKLTVG